MYLSVRGMLCVSSGQIDEGLLVTIVGISKGGYEPERDRREIVSVWRDSLGSRNEKGGVIADPALIFVVDRRLLSELLPADSCQTYETEAEEKQGGGFGDRDSGRCKFCPDENRNIVIRGPDPIRPPVDSCNFSIPRPHGAAVGGNDGGCCPIPASVIEII